MIHRVMLQPCKTTKTSFTAINNIYSNISISEQHYPHNPCWQVIAAFIGYLYPRITYTLLSNKHLASLHKIYKEKYFILRSWHSQVFHYKILAYVHSVFLWRGKVRGEISEEKICSVSYMALM